MSRVHDALRRAEQQSGQPVAPSDPVGAGIAPGASAAIAASPGGVVSDVLSRVRQVPFTPSPDGHLIDLTDPNQAPAEEFRSLRTRLNHMQGLRPIHSVVVTSPSPAEGKSFAAVNLAITESQLEGNPTLLIDCDFRRPIIHNFFGLDRGPGLTDYLQGKAALEDCIVRISNSNLFVIPAGEPVVNPLELLNLREMKLLLDELPHLFRWVILDSPPLLFAADANLLSTMSSGAILVVRIGSTTVDSVTRAIQSLCEDNVLGVIVNGARRGELYSKYTYYHSYYYSDEESETVEAKDDE
jgi:receptor protein-tyrosine kinase